MDDPEFVPVTDRCFKGCGRRADVRIEAPRAVMYQDAPIVEYRFCSRCYLAMLVAARAAA